MKAAYIDRYGGPEVLRVGELPAPAAGAGDVLIRVRAASVNPVDFKIRDGKVRAVIRYRFPLILGNDCAGEVAAVGAAVRRFKPGDRVYARLDKGRIGAFAEYAVASEASVAAMPRNLDFVQAAALPLAGLTAWQAMVELARLGRGQKALIHAGSGGVGSLAIQIARHLGAFVATTVGGRNTALARELGADRIIDYGKERFDEAGREYDFVLCTLSGDILERSLRVLRPGGMLVDIAGMPTAKWGARHGLNPFVRLALAWMTRRPERLARALDVRYEYLFMHPSGDQLAALAALVESGELRPVLDSVHTLDQAPAALARVESGRATGKVVVRID